MHIFLGIFGIIISFLLVAKREQVGDMLGEAEWMQKIGGVYNTVIVLALLIFFWSLAYMTGTLGILFAPIIAFFKPKPL